MCLLPSYLDLSCQRFAGFSLVFSKNHLAVLVILSIVHSVAFSFISALILYFLFVSLLRFFPLLFDYSSFIPYTQTRSFFFFFYTNVEALCCFSSLGGLIDYCKVSNKVDTLPFTSECLSQFSFHPTAYPGSCSYYLLPHYCNRCLLMPIISPPQLHLSHGLQFSFPKHRYNQVASLHTSLSRVSPIKSRFLGMAFKALTYFSCFLQLPKPHSMVSSILAYLKFLELMLYFCIIFI